MTIKRQDKFVSRQEAVTGSDHPLNNTLCFRGKKGHTMVTEAFLVLLKRNLQPQTAS